MGIGPAMYYFIFQALGWEQLTIGVALGLVVLLVVVYMVFASIHFRRGGSI